MAILVILVVVGSSVWVYADAQTRDWTAGGGTFRSPGSWLLVCVLLWIVAFPLYLARRGQVPKKAVTP